MTVTMKTTAALALLALSCISTVPPAFADGTRAGANNLRAAYQAEGRGATDFGANSSTDVLPTVANHAHVGSVDIVSHTDAGLARLLGIGHQGTTASVASSR
jgi:hypothetical protein